MKYLLSLAAGVAALALASTANAATVGTFGINPDSAAGAFSTNSVPGGLPTGFFSDQWTFDLVGAPAFVTIASVTNVYPGGTGSSDFISGFTAAIYRIVGIIGPGGGADIAVIGPTAATVGANLQNISGIGLITAGSYYAQFEGIAGSSAGYGGNLAVNAIPIPAALPLFGTALAGMFLLHRRRRHQV